MRLATSLEHRDFFLKNKFIEFEGLLSFEECSFLMTQPHATDLWRKEAICKKISLNADFADIALTLCNKKTNKRALRLAFDTLLTTPEEKVNLPGSCLNKVAIALLIPLTGPQAGNGIFFTPEFALPPIRPAFLIVYCEEKTFFVSDKADPYMRNLKKMGYCYGDLLKNDTHPLLNKISL